MLLTSGKWRIHGLYANEITIQKRPGRSIFQNPVPLVDAGTDGAGADTRWEEKFINILCSGARTTYK